MCAKQVLKLVGLSETPSAFGTFAKHTRGVPPNPDFRIWGRLGGGQPDCWVSPGCEMGLQVSVPLNPTYLLTLPIAVSERMIE